MSEPAPHPLDDAFARDDGGLAHPTVRATFSVLRDGNRADAVLVYRRLCERFPWMPGTDDQAACLDAVRVYKSQTGRESENGYVNWRSAQEAPHPYPSVGQVKRVLGPGGWTAVKHKAFGTPLPDVDAESLTRRGVEFPRKLLKRAVLTWAKEEPPPYSHPRFFEWARREMAKPNPRFPTSAAQPAAVRARVETMVVVLEDLQRFRTPARDASGAARRPPVRPMTDAERRASNVEAPQQRPLRRET